jgi:hypothetical protein
LSAISARLDREYLAPRTDEAGRYCTTEAHKTHKTESREVRYAWHPFYGREVVIQGERNRRGSLMLICTSEGDENGAVMEVPTWMFDAAVCCLFRSGSFASVNIQALRSLQSVLNYAGRATEDVIEAQHQSADSGGSDAQTTEGSSHADQAVSRSCLNAATATGSPHEDSGSSCAAATPARIAKRKPSSRGGAPG